MRNPGAPRSTITEPMPRDARAEPRIDQEHRGVGAEGRKHLGAVDDSSSRRPIRAVVLRSVAAEPASGSDMPRLITDAPGREAPAGISP